MVGCFFTVSLPPQILPISTCNISTNGKQDVLKQPETNTDLLYFQLWAVIKALLKKISQYLLSHFRIRIIVLTCPDINKPARNHQPKSCVPAKSHKLQLRGQYYFNWNLRPHFSLSLFVWRLESTTTKSLLRHLHCRGFPLFKSRRSKLCSKWRNNMDAFVALQLSRCIPTNR